MRSENNEAIRKSGVEGLDIAGPQYSCLCIVSSSVVITYETVQKIRRQLREIR